MKTENTFKFYSSVAAERNQAKSIIEDNRMNLGIYITDIDHESITLQTHGQLTGSLQLQAVFNIAFRLGELRSGYKVSK
jgi:hypothetical protein